MEINVSYPRHINPPLYLPSLPSISCSRAFLSVLNAKTNMSPCRQHGQYPNSHVSRMTHSANNSENDQNIEAQVIFCARYKLSQIHMNGIFYCLQHLVFGLYSGWIVCFFPFIFSISRLFSVWCSVNFYCCSMVYFRLVDGVLSISRTQRIIQTRRNTHTHKPRKRENIYFMLMT